MHLLKKYFLWLLILFTILINIACTINHSDDSADYLQRTFNTDKSQFEIEVKIFNYPDSLKSYYLHAYSLKAGKDGKIYIGLSDNINNAHLCMYYPEKDIIRDLGSLKDAIPKESFEKENHAKIHVGPYQDIDGAVYFASSYSEIDMHKYRSPGRLFRYTAEEGIVDLGIMLPDQAYYFMHGDDKNRKLYFASIRNSNFIVYDLRTGDWEDKGKFSSKTPHLGLTDKSGRLYMYAHKGSGEWKAGSPAVARYDPESDKLEITQNAPPAPWVGAVTPDQNTVFTTNYRKAHLFKWELSDWPDFKIERIGPIDPDGRKVYSNNLSLALNNELIVMAGTINPENNNNKQRIHGIWGYQIDSGKKYFMADLTDLITKSIGRDSRGYEIYWTNANTKDKNGWIYIGFYTNQPEDFHVGRLLAIQLKEKK